MKDWSADHPKAKLMARKRAAILDAARHAFLQEGYEGVSMESIASAAGVSIMTLYRHADSKDDLFNAVITHVCDFSGETRDAKFAETLPLPLDTVLLELGMMFQAKLVSQQTIALIRTVMSEATRFPQLASTAYNSLVGGYQDNLAHYLTLRPEAQSLTDVQHTQLSTVFIESLIGAPLLRALLGLEDSTPPDHAQKAQAATDELIKQLDILQNNPSQ